MINQQQESSPPGLFVVSGSPYADNLKFRGVPLLPEQLFLVLDISRPGLESVSNAVQAGDLSTAAACLLYYYQRRKEPDWPVWPAPTTPSVLHRPKERVRPLKAYPDDVRVAENAIQHIFQPYAAYPAKDYGRNIDWDWDPYDNIEWPAAMHRMKSWDMQAARCYSMTGDERYARLWVDLTTDWIMKYPVNEQSLYPPRNWNAIQVGCRCVRWSGLMPYYLDSPAFSPGFLVSLLTSLYNHARLTMQMPYPRPDNFAVIETSGLADVALIFPEFREAVAWREAAFSRLAAIIRQQYTSDGVHGELVPGYHLGSTNLYLNTVENAVAAGNRFPESDFVQKMCDVVAGISAPDCRLFYVGDTNSRTDVRPVLTRAARLFGRSDFLALATDGKQGQWPARMNSAFPVGGFYSFRSDWSDEAIWMAMHCGPAPTESWHSHADNGTFELMAYGRLLMRDPGVFSYINNDPMRHFFKRTLMHQTLTLNSENNAKAGRLLCWEEDDGSGNASVTVENASYQNLTHRRTIFFLASRFFVIVDEALGTAYGDFDLHFQFTPGPVEINHLDKMAYTAFPEGGNVVIWAAPDAPVNIEAEKAFLSSEHYQKEPLPAVRYRHTCHNAPVRFLSVIVPFKGITVPTVHAAVIGGDIGERRLQVELTINGEVCSAQRTLRPR